MEQKDIDTYYRNNALLGLKNSKGIEKNIVRAGKSQQYLLHLKDDIVQIQNKRNKIGNRTAFRLGTRSKKEENDDEYEKNLAMIKERGKLMRNKEENKEIEKYNSDIDRIIPLNIYDNKMIPAHNRSSICKKVLFNVINNFHNISNSNFGNNDDTLESENSLRSTKHNTFRIKQRKGSTKRLTIFNSKLKLSFNKKTKKHLETEPPSPVYNRIAFLDNKLIRACLKKEVVTQKDLFELEENVNIKEIDVPVLKAIGAKYCENIQDPQEKEIMNDILNNGDPNGLVLLIQKLKKNITHLEIGGRVLEKKKKDTNLRRYLSMNRTANELDKKLIRNMYFHANIE